MSDWLQPVDAGAHLAHEQSVNDHYIKTLEAVFEKRRNIVKGVPAPRNAQWHGRGSGGSPGPRAGPLIGRVALTVRDDDLGSDFYIGDGHLAPEDMPSGSGAVVGWAAPVADVFFQGCRADMSGTENGVDPATLTARRTFVHTGDQIDRFEDQIEEGSNGVNAFPLSRLSVPPPPRGPLAASELAPCSAVPSSSAVTPGASPRLAVPPPPTAVQPVNEATGRNQYPNTSPPATSRTADVSQGGDSDPGSRPGWDRLRSGGLVRSALDRPRVGRLPTVLSLLQSDQHRYVTWPSDRVLLLQGSPGTGKTVIAAYRALYLTHPENETDRADRVAIIGPTKEWKHHVSDLINAAGVRGGVECLDLETLVRGFVPGLGHDLHHPSLKWFQTDWSLYRLASRAVSKLGKESAGDIAHQDSGPPDLRGVINAVTDRTPIHRALVSDLDCSRWLQSVGGYRQARKRPDCLLLLAAASVALEQAGHLTRRSSRLNRYDHIVVDEAQDIRGAEWAILHQMLATGGGWSIIGDMQQRRADHTYSTWGRLIDDLEMGDYSSNKESVLTTGYRSTRQIEQFARYLIDQPKQWRPDMLRDGSDVVVERAKAGRLPDRVLDQINRLTRLHCDGTVAVIGVDLHQIKRRAVKAGWRRDRQDGAMLSKDGCGKLLVADPVLARGLEFDAVVVVEPGAFPRNIGRMGALYTALTRAHRDLVVIHAKPLPDELRRAQRAASRRAKRSNVHQPVVPPNPRDGGTYLR